MMQTLSVDDKKNWSFFFSKLMRMNFNKTDDKAQ